MANPENQPERNLWRRQSPDIYKFPITKDTVLTNRDLLSLIPGMNIQQLYYWEREGYTHPKKQPRKTNSSRNIRFYSPSEALRVAYMVLYIQKGFKQKVAFKLANKDVAAVDLEDFDKLTQTVRDVFGKFKPMDKKDVLATTEESKTYSISGNAPEGETVIFEKGFKQEVRPLKEVLEEGRQLYDKARVLFDTSNPFGLQVSHDGKQSHRRAHERNRYIHAVFTVSETDKALMGGINEVVVGEIGESMNVELTLSPDTLMNMFNAGKDILMPAFLSVDICGIDGAINRRGEVNISPQNTSESSRTYQIQETHSLFQLVSKLVDENRLRPAPSIK